MRTIAKGFGYLLLMVVLLIVFLPKTNLYYALEKKIAEQSVYVSDEKLKDQGLAFAIEDAKVYFDKLLLAQVDQIRIFPLIVYNGIKLKGIGINEGFADFLPGDIQELEVSQWIYNPLHLKLSGKSEDILLFGDVDLLKKSLSIHLRLGSQSEKKYHTLLTKLNKEEGGYVYEYKF